MTTQGHHSAPTSVFDHRIHSPYSDPDRWSSLLHDVEPTIESISKAVRNTIVHYRASDVPDLPESTRGTINARWVSVLLDRDQELHAAALAAHREPRERVQGCCRDHTLLSVAILREHGIPARSRIGFTDYFSPTWHHDHVIVEGWMDNRWRRFDPELEPGFETVAEPWDIERGNDFHTAAEVWQGIRDGSLDAETYGVAEEVPDVRGQWFVRNYVIAEVAHRFGDELLLWDQWGAMQGPDDEITDAEFIDEVAALLVAGDDGDIAAEQRLLALYRGDHGLRPEDSVRTFDPVTHEQQVVALRR